MTLATLATGLALATPGRAAELNDRTQHIDLSAAPAGQFTNQVVFTSDGEDRVDPAADQPAPSDTAKVRIKTIQPITGLDLRQPVGSGRPDLTIKTAQPAPGNPSALRVLVENIGGKVSGPTNLILVYSIQGKQMTKGASVQRIAAGRTAWVIVQADTALAIAQQASLRVDEPNRIAEANESNNDYIVR